MHMSVCTIRTVIRLVGWQKADKNTESIDCSNSVRSGNGRNPRVKLHCEILNFITSTIFSCTEETQTGIFQS
jgi:hypothetical protein